MNLGEMLEKHVLQLQQFMEALLSKLREFFLCPDLPH